ncbi:MAG: DNA translocase FtsK 4TM domain-containing protein, partial [Alphaproteobacteria bacterium]|nr:DNA translocase FtsK 4TM domain-containing protein [Alphaproteobacteria bacterium]
MAARRSLGVYQPRSRKNALADQLAEARLAMVRFLRSLALRLTGLLLFAGTSAALLALVTYNSADASLDNATGAAPTNLLGSLGAVAADLLLQTFGIAALAALAPPAVWGVRALAGKPPPEATWRAVSWPLGALLIAAGLGVLPAPQALPAGAGGLIGIAAAGLASHVGAVYHQNWLAIALPLLLLL